MATSTFLNRYRQPIESNSGVLVCLQKLFKHTGLFIPAFVSVGCATQQIDTNGYRTRSYFGWLQVTERANSDPGEVRIERIKATGLRMGPSFGIGHFDDSAITLLPDCKLIVVIKDLPQFDLFLTTYPQFNQEKNPCVRPLDF